MYRLVSVFVLLFLRLCSIFIGCVCFVAGAAIAIDFFLLLLIYSCCISLNFLTAFLMHSLTIQNPNEMIEYSIFFNSAKFENIYF